MWAIVESDEVRVVRTPYVVPGWGVGELWTSERLVLAHDFDYGAQPTELGRAVVRLLDTTPAPASAGAVVAAPLEGARRPPTGTVPGHVSRVVDGFVPNPRRAGGDGLAPMDSDAPLDPHELVERFEAFLSGDDVRLDDVPVDLGWCTPFQRSVATALRAVPRGEVVSYGELAALAGYPGAQRAVGTFCARNRFALLVPCHRVVGATGIGSYGSAGVPVKRRLLALEGVVL
jgi:methylated-DNA-[protein]-cysteine S-methyltransferase